jgi:hypothetical protein
MNYFNSSLTNLNVAINSTNNKIDSIILNKTNSIIIFGPFYPTEWSITMMPTGTGYLKYSTQTPCLLNLTQKALVTLSATGHAMSNGFHG